MFEPIADIERSVLAALIVEPDVQDYVEKLDETDFKEPEHRRVLGVLKAMRAERRHIDVVTVGERSKKPALIAQITGSLVTTSNFPSHFTELKNKSARRKLYLAGKEISKMAEETEDSLELKNNVLAMVSDIQIEHMSKEDSAMQAVVSETYRYIEKRFEKKEDELLTTPFYDLNDIIGSLNEEELTVIAARPGVGKTAFALNIAEHLGRKKRKVLFVSREMSKPQIGIRLFAKNTGISSNKLRNGKLSDDEWKMVAKELGNLADLPLWFDTASRTIQDIRSEARELKNKEGLDVIIIDYLQLLIPRGKRQNREQEVAAMSRDIKLLTNEFKLPILLLSQLSRNAQGKRPILSDLRESGAIEQDADNVIFLHIPSDNEVKGELIALQAGLRNQGKELVETIVAKQRNGPVGMLYLGYDSGRLNFENLSRREEG